MFVSQKVALLQEQKLIQRSSLEFEPLAFTLRETRKGLFYFGYGRVDIKEDEFDYLRACFQLWVNSPLYITFYNSKTNKFEWHKAMKRGNEVYAYKLRKRIDYCSTFFNPGLLVRLDQHKFVSNVLFVSLTWNTNLYGSNRVKAWENVTPEYNKFITQLRQRFGDLWVFRTLEATEKGYPHIHLLIVAKKPFEVFLHKGEYRAKAKNKIAECWSSFVDVKAPYNLKSMKNYLTKDLFKQVYMKTPKDTLSLAFNWLFRKRAYAISSGNFFNDLINGLSIIQMNLATQIKEICSKDVVFCGFVTIRGYRGTPPPDQFTCELSKEDFDSLFNTIIKPSNEFFDLALKRGYSIREIDEKRGYFYD
jgi:hypothetical protein